MFLINVTGGIEGYGDYVFIPGSDPIFVVARFTSTSPGPNYEAFGAVAGTFDPETGEFVEDTTLFILGGQGPGTFRDSHVWISDTVRHIGVGVAVTYIDERHDWNFVVTITTLDTLPLLFMPLVDDGPIEEVSDGIFETTGSTVVYHQDATIGLVGEQGGWLIEQQARQATLNPGTYHVAFLDDLDSSLGTVRLFADADSGALPVLSFADPILFSENFALDRGLAIGWLDVRPDSMVFDARGVMFGFQAILPDRIGSVTFGSDPRRLDEASLTVFSQLIGKPVWEEAFQPDVRLLDLFMADLRNIKVKFDEHAEVFSWKADVILNDFIGEGSRLRLRVQDGEGFYANGQNSGLDGILTAGRQVRVPVGDGPNPFNLILDNFTLVIDEEAEDVLTITTGFSWQSGGRTMKLPAAVADIVVDAEDFELQQITLTLGDGVEKPKAVLGRIAHFEGGLYGLGSDDGEPTTFGADLEIHVGADEFGDVTGQLARVRLLGGVATDATFFAGLELSLGNFNEMPLFTGAGQATENFLTGVTTGSLAGQFALPFFGSFAAGASFTMARNTLQLAGQAVVTLPTSIGYLLGISTEVTMSLDVAIMESLAASHITLMGNVVSDSFGGWLDIGIRVSLDGNYDLIGALDFNEVSPFAAMRAPEDGIMPLDAGDGPGSRSFTLDNASQGLAMRAEGEVDAADVTIVAPDGTRYTTADFAGRSIEILNDDATGVTLLVRNAEAGTWTIEAAGADAFAGLADLPDIALDVESNADGTGLVATATWPGGAPAQGYEFRVYADSDGQDFDGVQVFQIAADMDGRLELDYASLGLAPGEYFFHVEAWSPGLLPTEAYLAGPVTLTAVADLAIAADYFWVPSPLVDEFPDDTTTHDPIPMLGITVTNEGTATAWAPRLEVIGPSTWSEQIADLAPGETRHFLLDLSGSGVIPGTDFIAVEISTDAYEADLLDNIVEDEAILVDAPGPRNDLATGQEDAIRDIYPLNNDDLGGPVTLVRGPTRGSVELFEDRGFFYAPDPDFNGTDVFTYAAGGGEAQVWITVAPVNDAPVLVAPIADVTVVVTQPLDIRPSANAFDDVDGIAFTYDLTTEAGDPLPGWISFDAETGRITGTPVAADLGTLTLVLAAYDPAGEAASDTFTLTVQAPGGGTDGPDNLSGSNLADAILALGGNDTVNGRNGADTIEGGDGEDRLLGAGGNDLLAGGGDRDALTGAAGRDTLAGGAARDRLLGGEGADLFRFAEYGGADQDLIADFAPGEDVIAVSAAVFGGGLVAGALGAAQFRTALNARATSEAGTGQFVYETDTGKLWWDADGAGGVASQIVARLGPIPSAALAAGDILVIA